jgi:hypothetical protein
MKVFSSSEIQRVIDALPADPANQPVLSLLLGMRAEQEVVRQPYNFEVDFATGVVQGSTNLFAAPAAAGGVVQGFFLVDTSAPFMLVSTTFQSDLAGGAVTVSTRVSPNWVITIQDQASNRNWQNGPVPIPSIFGDAKLPYFWPEPRLIPANTNILLTVTNYDAAAVHNTRLTFQGYRLYSAGV